MADRRRPNIGERIMLRGIDYPVISGTCGLRILYFTDPKDGLTKSTSIMNLVSILPPEQVAQAPVVESKPSPAQNKATKEALQSALNQIIEEMKND